MTEQSPPCSATCYNHVSHPCEKCGKLRGIPAPSWAELKKTIEILTDAIEDACLNLAQYGETPPVKWLDAFQAGKAVKHD